MQPKIRNRSELLSAGDCDSRAVVLDIMDAALQRLDAGRRIRSMASRQGDWLTIGARQWDLSKKAHVYVIGAGKACNAMAMAMESILGDRLTHGIAIVKIQDPQDCLTRIKVRVGGHPIPTQAGYDASVEILDLVEQSGPDDLFICLMSGGSSALMSCPVPGISLEDERAATDILLKSGAGIREINAVRRHISRINGGRLAQAIARKGAELIGFNISDAIGNPPTHDISIPWPDFSGTPMGPDQTTFQDALACIRKYNLADRLPASVIRYLSACGPEEETPKAFPQNTYYQLNTLPDSITAAQQAVAAMGLSSLVLSTFVEGEAKDMGTLLACIAKEIQTYQRPAAPPCVVLSAGESVTTIPDSRCIKGHGGPSQEMALSFAVGAAGAPGACLISIDTEGTDGTAPAAGGLADSQSLSAMEQAGVDVYASLREHSSFEALSAAHCAVITGNTGTNLCDLNIMYVPPKGETQRGEA